MKTALRAAAFAVSLPVVALAQTPAPAGAPARCAALTLSEFPVCLDTPSGVVLAADRAEGARNAAYAAAGEVRFRRHFDRAPPPYALVVGRVTPEVTRTLKTAGISAVLPWLTADQKRVAFADSARRGAEAQAKAANLDAAKTAELVATVGRNYQARYEKQGDRDAGVVPHELGHLWLIHAFWPGAGVDRGGHYGGPGPDWLDETAAILMEDERLATDRRDQFRLVYKGQAKGDLAGRHDPLATFLAKDHPMKGLQDRLKPGANPGGGPRVVVMTADERRAGNPGLDVNAGARFYLQGRAFADFLVDRTGDPAVFAAIGAALAKGQTLEQWLATEGEGRGLGRSVAEMEAVWNAWLQARFGPAAATMSGRRDHSGAFG